MLFFLAAGFLVADLLAEAAGALLVWDVGLAAAVFFDFGVLGSAGVMLLSVPPMILESLS